MAKKIISVLLFNLVFFFLTTFLSQTDFFKSTLIISVYASCACEVTPDGYQCNSGCTNAGTRCGGPGSGACQGPVTPTPTTGPLVCPLASFGSSCPVSSLCKIKTCYGESWLVARWDDPDNCVSVNFSNEPYQTDICEINLSDLTLCGVNLEPSCRSDADCSGGKRCNILCDDMSGQPIGTCETPIGILISPTPTSPLPTPTPSSQWFKVLEGDVHANSTLLDTSIVAAVPADRYFADRETAPRTQGSVVSSAGTFSNPLQARLHSDPNKQFKVQRQPVSSKLTDQNYTYFKNKYAGKDTAPDAYESRCSGLAIPHNLSGKTVWYFSNPAVTYKLCGGGNYSGRAAVIIEGSLEIQDNLDLAVNSALAFFVKGGITVRNNVSRIAGFYLTDGQFDTGFANNQELTVNGSVVADSFSLRRQKINNSEPAEVFVYQPSLLLNLVDILGERKYNWREVRR